MKVQTMSDGSGLSEVGCSPAPREFHRATCADLLVQRRMDRIRFRGTSDENLFTRLEIVSQAGKLVKRVYAAAVFESNKEISHQSR